MSLKSLIDLVNKRKFIYFCILPSLAFLSIGYFLGVSTVELAIEQASFTGRVKSVREYGPLRIGGQFGPQTNFPGPRDYPIEMADDANFFIHAVQKDLGLCMFDSCGMGGVLVECMNGWLSGNSHEEISDEVGLDDKWDDVLAGKASMVVVSDRNSKIVGIYPNSTTHDLPRILRKHSNLTENAKECFEYNMSNI